LVFWFAVRRFDCVIRALAFPWFVSGLLALPLCGAALTFFAAAKKVSKESGLQPPALKRVPWLGGGSGASGVCVFAHFAPVTRQSFFRRRCARRGGCSWPSALGLLAFPCFASGLLALPLCGAALTFFAAAKKVSKESGLQPLVFKWVPWLGGGSGASGVCVLARFAFVTRQSCFRRRCARRSGRSQTI
jgi:hypothetical protein